MIINNMPAKDEMLGKPFALIIPTLPRGVPELLPQCVVNSGCCDGGMTHRDADLVKPASHVTGHE